MNRKLMFLAVPLLLFPLAGRAQKRAFTIEDLYRVKHIDDMHVSPDGRQIVFTLVSQDLVQLTDYYNRIPGLQVGASPGGAMSRRAASTAAKVSAPAARRRASIRASREGKWA